jgi:hypothetical protein
MPPKKVKNDNLEELETLANNPKIKTIKKVVQQPVEYVDDETDDDEVEAPPPKIEPKIGLKSTKGIKIVGTGFPKANEQVKKPLKKKIIQTIVEVETDDEEEMIQPVKQKRQQSEKQKQNTEKMRAKLQEYHAKKKEEKQMIEQLKQKEEQERKKKIEEKIVNKAISIKKKQIKKEEILDEVSDDDTPIEEIKQKIISKKLPAKEKVIERQLPTVERSSLRIEMPTPIPQKPKFIFI